MLVSICFILFAWMLASAESIGNGCIPERQANRTQPQVRAVGMPL